MISSGNSKITEPATGTTALQASPGINVVTSFLLRPMIVIYTGYIYGTGQIEINLRKKYY